MVQIVAQKQEADVTRNRLCDAIQIMHETGISDTVKGEVQKKLDEYGKISRNYGNMLEDLWGITWHWERTLEKYLDSNDNDIDGLPDYIQPV